MTPLLTPRDLASQLNVSEPMLATWRYRGDGPPFVKVGRSVRYRPEAVAAWLDARTHTITRECAS